MGLSNNLVSQFAKIVNNEKKTKKETTLYGTFVIRDGKKYVKLDGSDLLTPVIQTADAKNDERVSVTIKNHTAIVTGNVSSPAARTGDVEENTNKIEDLTYTANSALSLSKENSTHISYLESDYVVTHNKLENLEKDSVYIHAALNSQSDAIHVLHDKVTTIEEETIPNLETKVDLAYTTINDRIQKIVELLGASSKDEIANTVLERILELEDETAHMAWHESHPETSVWGTFGIMTSCGYKSNPCISY